MPEPLISIIVPTYNRADLLPATLKSLQAQGNRDFEIIIIDDGSTDNTEEVVKPFSNQYTRYVKKANAERAAARNYGARLARGMYVNFFDSDDLALTNHTDEATRMIQYFQHPQWFHLAFEWVTPEGSIFRKVNNNSGETLNRQMALGNQLSCNGVFIRRDIFLQHLFNEDRALSASEDYELWLRLSARYPLYYSNSITSQVVDHEMRSVRSINGQKLIDRLELFIHYIKQDIAIKKYYGSSLRQIYMDAWSYIALHLGDYRSGKIKSFIYLLRAFRQSPRLLLTKRFYASLKNWIFKWKMY